MLFADLPLARRIEAAECRFCVDVVDAVRTRLGDNAFAIRLGGAAAVFAGVGSPFNKVVGLGFDRTPREAEFEEVEVAYGRRGSPVRVELSTLADASIAARLTQRGYVLIGHEHVLGLALRRNAAVPAPQATRLPSEDMPSFPITVESVARKDTQAWGSVVAEGFEQPDTTWSHAHESFSDAVLRQTFEDMGRSPASRPYLARWKGEPAGGGYMRVDEGIAQLSGASTLPAFRRRGVQSALLQARLADAAREGCELAVVTTDAGSKSHQNAQRQGFELLYARAVLVKPAP